MKNGGEGRGQQYTRSTTRVPRAPQAVTTVSLHAKQPVASVSSPATAEGVHAMLVIEAPTLDTGE